MTMLMTMTTTMAMTTMLIVLRRGDVNIFRSDSKQSFARAAQRDLETQRALSSHASALRGSAGGQSAHAHILVSTSSVMMNVALRLPPRSTQAPPP